MFYRDETFYQKYHKSKEYNVWGKKLQSGKGHIPSSINPVTDSIAANCPI